MTMPPEKLESGHERTLDSVLEAIRRQITEITWVAIDPDQFPLNSVDQIIDLFSEFIDLAEEQDNPLMDDLSEVDNSIDLILEIDPECRFINEDRRRQLAFLASRVEVQRNRMALRQL